MESGEQDLLHAWRILQNSYEIKDFEVLVKIPGVTEPIAVAMPRIVVAPYVLSKVRRLETAKMQPYFKE